MNRVLNYILGGVTIILLTLLAAQGCQKMKLQKELTQSELNYSILQAKWWKLITTPPKITYITTPVEITNDHPVTPTPIPDETDASSTQTQGKGTLANQGDSCKPTRYNETYDLGDTIHVWWTAKAHGIITQFSINKIAYPSHTKIVERYIPCDPVDTAGIVRKYSKVKNELWLYAKPTMVFPFKVANVTAGIQWQIRRKWGIGAGTGYDWNIKSPIVEGVLLFNLK